MWIDSHCHLNHAAFDGRTPFDIIEDFEEQKIDGCITICCRIAEELDQLLEISSKSEKVNCSIGTHPCDASNDKEKAITLEQLIELANSNENIVGIGESGLDYYWDKSTPEDQVVSFRKHIHAAQETGLPLIVHARDADEDVGKILKEEYQNSSYNCIMHCYSSGEKLAMQALEMGFYISFSGIVTFNSAKELQNIALKVPADKILVETDAPFLAPTPHRGKTNQPSYVRHTGEFLAQLRGQDVEEFAKITTDNFYNVFKTAKFG